MSDAASGRPAAGPGSGAADRPTGTAVGRAVEEAFREEWGRVLAAVARWSGDLDLAEEVTSEAFTTALVTWARDGIPDRPGAWLTTTARRHATDRLRRRAVERDKTARSARLSQRVEASPAAEADRVADPVGEAVTGALTEAWSAGSADEDLLALVFACCHPALPLEGRVALTLRSLTGMTTAQVARAFLVPEATMAQRLVRVRKRIRTTGISFRVPPPELRRERVSAVLAVLYVLFTEGYDAWAEPTDHGRDGTAGRSTAAGAPAADSAGVSSAAAGSAAAGPAGVSSAAAGSAAAGSAGVGSAAAGWAGAGWAGADVRRRLADDAVRLARLVARLLPDEPEAQGLLALVLLQHARREARVGPDGVARTLGEQDRSRWRRAEIDEGVRVLDRVLSRRRPGPYQVQAAIAALHSDAPSPAETDWVEILGLYDVLVEMTGSPVVLLNRAVALAEVVGPEAGLAAVDEIEHGASGRRGGTARTGAGGRTARRGAAGEGGPLGAYHLFPAVRADLLRRLGRPAEAAREYRRALEAVDREGDRRLLARRLADLADEVR